MITVLLSPSEMDAYPTDATVVDNVLKMVKSKGVRK